MAGVVNRGLELSEKVRRLPVLLHAVPTDGSFWQSTHTTEADDQRPTYDLIQEAERQRLGAPQQRTIVAVLVLHGGLVIGGGRRLPYGNSMGHGESSVWLVDRDSSRERIAAETRGSS